MSLVLFTGGQNEGNYSKYNLVIPENTLRNNQIANIKSDCYHSEKGGSFSAKTPDVLAEKSKAPENREALTEYCQAVLLENLHKTANPSAVIFSLYILFQNLEQALIQKGTFTCSLLLLYLFKPDYNKFVFVKFLALIDKGLLNYGLLMFLSSLDLALNIGMNNTSMNYLKDCNSIVFNEGIQLLITLLVKLLPSKNKIKFNIRKETAKISSLFFNQDICAKDRYSLITNIQKEAGMLYWDLDLKKTEKLLYKAAIVPVATASFTYNIIKVAVPIVSYFGSKALEYFNKEPGETQAAQAAPEDSTKGAAPAAPEDSTKGAAPAAPENPTTGTAPAAPENPTKGTAQAAPEDSTTGAASSSAVELVSTEGTVNLGSEKLIDFFSIWPKKLKQRYNGSFNFNPNFENKRKSWFQKNIGTEAISTLEKIVLQKHNKNRVIERYLSKNQLNISSSQLEAYYFQKYTPKSSKLIEEALDNLTAYAIAQKNKNKEFSVYWLLLYLFKDGYSGYAYKCLLSIRDHNFTPQTFFYFKKNFEVFLISSSLKFSTTTGFLYGDYYTVEALIFFVVKIKQNFMSSFYKSKKNSIYHSKKWFKKEVAKLKEKIFMNEKYKDLEKSTNNPIKNFNSILDFKEAWFDVLIHYLKVKPKNRSKARVFSNGKKTEALLNSKTSIQSSDKAIEKVEIIVQGVDKTATIEKVETIVQDVNKSGSFFYNYNNNNSSLSNSELQKKKTKEKQDKSIKIEKKKARERRYETPPNSRILGLIKNTAKAVNQIFVKIREIVYPMPDAIAPSEYLLENLTSSDTWQFSEEQEQDANRYSELLQKNNQKIKSLSTQERDAIRYSKLLLNNDQNLKVLLKRNNETEKRDFYIENR